MNFSIRGTVKTQEEEEQCSCRSVERHQKILFNNSEGGYELFCWREKEKRKWEGVPTSTFQNHADGHSLTE